MYDGVKAMIDAEKELGGGPPKAVETPDVACGPHLKKPEQLTGFPAFPEGQ